MEGVAEVKKGPKGSRARKQTKKVKWQWHKTKTKSTRTRNRREHGHDDVIFQHPVQRVTKEVGSAIKPESTAKQGAEESENLSSAAFDAGHE